jgi:hypothetical protein
MIDVREIKNFKKGCWSLGGGMAAIVLKNRGEGLSRR